MGKRYLLSEVTTLMDSIRQIEHLTPPALLGMYNLFPKELKGFFWLTVIAPISILRLH